MKVCLINNLYKPWNRGGADQITSLFYQGLTSKGVDVFIIATKPYFSFRKDEIKERIYYLSSCYYYLGKIPKALRLFWHLWDMFDVLKCLQVFFILKKEKPQVVITNNLKGVSFLLPFLFKILKIKHIHIVHDLQLIHPSGLMLWGKEKYFNSLPSKIYARICTFLFLPVNIVIFPSSWTRDEHKKYGFFKKSRQLILPNPVVLPSRPDIKKQQNHNFLYIGEIVEHKGILFLIKAFNDLAREYKDIKLLAIGDGAQLNEAKKMAGKAVKLLGRRPHEEVVKLMQESFALIVPSLCYENSPTVIYEACSLGLPVIASRIGGIEELVHSLGGVLFKPACQDDLKRKIKWVLDNEFELRRMGERSREKIKEYSLDKYIKKIKDILN